MRIIAAGITLQTLFFKFTGAPESIYIFETMDMEPRGRYRSGFAELIVSVLILILRTIWLGAGIGLGVISGAIISHITKPGIDVQGDGGLLFFMAVAVFLCCLTALYLHRDQIANPLGRR